MSPKVFISPSTQQANLYAAQGTNEEIQMNLVADIICPRLTQHGVEWMRNNRHETFREAVIASNAYKPDLHVALHSNAGGTTARGLTIFCYKPVDHPAGTPAPRTGQQLAENLYKYLEPLTPTEDRGIKDGSSSLSEVGDTTAPAVLIEYDFHDKVDGAQWIYDHKDDLAEATVRGIVDQLGIPYLPVSPVLDYQLMYTELSIVHGELQEAYRKQGEDLQVLVNAHVALQKIVRDASVSVKTLIEFSNLTNYS